MKRQVPIKRIRGLVCNEMMTVLAITPRLTTLSYETELLATSDAYKRAAGVLLERGNENERHLITYAFRTLNLKHKKGNYTTL